MADAEWFDKAVLDPADVYARPDEVLTDTRLTMEQKRRVLEAWKLDAERLSESESEGMGGGARPRLGDVERALIKLKEAGG